MEYEFKMEQHLFDDDDDLEVDSAPSQQMNSTDFLHEPSMTSPMAVQHIRGPHDDLVPSQSIGPGSDSGVGSDLSHSQSQSLADLLETLNLTSEPASSPTGDHKMALQSICDRSVGMATSLPVQVANMEWETAMQAVRSNPAMCFTQDDDGDTILHVAIIQGQLKYVLHLIHLQTSPALFNIRNGLQQTVLHLAVLKGYSKVVRLLLALGAKGDLRDRNGNSALHLACREGHMECVRMLTVPLSTEESCSCTCSLVQDPSLMNYNGQTCLHLAAQNNHLNIVTYLLEDPVRSDVNVADGTSGRTILHHAVEARQMALIDLLLQHRFRLGLLLDAQSYCGNTAHSLAVGRGFYNIAEFLAMAGATPVCDCENDYGRPQTFEYANESDDTVYYDDFCIGGKPMGRIRPT